jgi:poly(A) polymerase
VTTRLEGQDWLDAAPTRAVLAALEAAGGPGCARFVGGCVRNALMGRPIDDVDMATTLRPEETERAIRAAGLKAVPTGMAHGTVTAVAARRPFEITTLRRDVSTDGRNATVAFTDDWAEDAARRDFRLNALYADGEGRVFDPTGHGIADTEAGRIVFVGDPSTRIREDYLRIPRFFRFHAWYGRGEPDAAGLAACAALAPGMSRLSAERVCKEMLKLLAAPDPRASMRAMAEAGVLAEILPEAGDLALFEAAAPLSDDPVVRLAALLPADVEIATRTAKALRLPNTVRDRLVGAAKALPAITLDMTQPAARAAIYAHGRRAVADALLRRRAEAAGREVEGGRLSVLAETWIPPRLPVGGDDLARLGVEPGPETGRLLKAFEAEWVAEDFPTAGHAERLERLVRVGRG